MSPSELERLMRSDTVMDGLRNGGDLPALIALAYKREQINILLDLRHAAFVRGLPELPSGQTWHPRGNFYTGAPLRHAPEPAPAPAPEPLKNRPRPRPTAPPVLMRVK